MAPRRQGRPADDGLPAPRRAVRADRAPGGDARLALREPGAAGPVAPAGRRRLAHTRAGSAFAPVLPRRRAREARRTARRGARGTAAVAPAGAARPGRVADRGGPRGDGHAPARAPRLLASESRRRPPGSRRPRRTARLHRDPAGLPPPARGLLRFPRPQERDPGGLWRRLGALRHARLRRQRLRVVPPGRVGVPRDRAAPRVPAHLRDADDRRGPLPARPREHRGAALGVVLLLPSSRLPAPRSGRAACAGRRAVEDRSGPVVSLARPRPQAARGSRGLSDAPGRPSGAREAPPRDGGLGARRTLHRARIRRRPARRGEGVDGAGAARAGRHRLDRVADGRATRVRADVAGRCAHHGPREVDRRGASPPGPGPPCEGKRERARTKAAGRRGALVAGSRRFDREHTWVVETTPWGHPRQIGGVVPRPAETRRDRRGAYPVAAAVYMGPQSARILTSHNLGYVD